MNHSVFNIIWFIVPLVIIFSLLRSLLIERSLPKAHRVALIGHRRSGKTSLITTIFNEIFAERLSGFNASLRGLSTIERINKDSRSLEEGTPLGPSSTQDIFAYSCNIGVGNSIFQRIYKVEFADFPGNLSEELAKSEELLLLKDPEFFKWTSTADAFIFIIDLAEYLTSKQKGINYVALMTSNIRASWQKLVYLHEDPSNSFMNKPLVLAFAKCDLFGISNKPTKVAKTVQRIMKLGFDVLPNIEEIDIQKYNEGTNRVIKDFSELITFFRNKSNKFKPIFVSSFGLIDGKRVGLEELLESVLPYELARDVVDRLRIRINNYFTQKPTDNEPSEKSNG